MSQNELLPIVNEAGKVIGKATRKECHSNPKLIHPVVHCWLFNTKGEVLWQQRSLQKDTSPGKWDMSCGGHIQYGESPQDTLRRELAEELGLTNIDPTFVCKFLYKKPSQTELVYLYYAIVDIKAQDIKFQKEEIETLEWIKPDVAQKLVLENKRQATKFIFTEVTKILRFLAFKS